MMMGILNSPCGGRLLRFHASLKTKMEIPRDDCASDNSRGVVRRLAREPTCRGIPGKDLTGASRVGGRSLERRI